jgi:glycosyltransferase involved in cell wall biosynthesis
VDNRILLVLAPDATRQLAGTATDAVGEIGRRDRVAVTVVTGGDGRAAERAQLATYSLVHVVGTPTLRLLGLWRDRVPLVVTPARRPRRGPRLLRRGASDCTWWLVHGRVLAERLTADAVAPGTRVVPLPVLPSLGIAAGEWPAHRAVSRSALGASPGTRVVVGIGGLTDGCFDDFRRAVRLLGRRDVLPVWVAVDAEPVGSGTTDDGIRLTGTATADRWLPAMDVLVAAGTSYNAVSPAVDAARAGIPVVSTPYNVAADFVDPTAGGSFLASSGPAELADALLHSFRGVGRRRGPRLLAGEPDPLEELVARTEQCYAHALGRPLRATTTLLRGLSA